MDATVEFADHNDYLSKLVAAVERERVIRAVAEVSGYETIAGFKVKPMTLFHYLALRDVMESPMLPPFTSPTPVELAAFLWLLSPGYNREGKGRERFLKTCRAFVVPTGLFSSPRRRRRASDRFAKTVAAAREYVEEALMDRPGAARSGGGEPDYYCDSVALCATLAREYGWSRESVMAMPMKILFQHLKEIKEYRAAVHGQPVLMGNPSDGIKSAYLEQANRRNN